ncbi:Spy/CpxP family protein refolding chaperone [Parapedobacter sp. 10938]|uniref:Spy/CpxP family protein refolding chaperone n=1 Tax=Parapedobacter flavus TaxID=3110225 RepID=UPI002DBCA6BA|nr:Spy/CpxP family protein refolding chaperone [Parapedobacter sp. 10938]MEC3879782.1 Spy/CpxP family protein refolding chaperone [Parapedobacter sp. 10938]
MMKNAVLITLLLSGMAFSAFAQERERRTLKSAEEIAQMRTDRLTEELTLSEEQQRAVYELSLEDAKKMQAERKDRRAQSEATREERATQMGERREAMKASQERLNKVLTGEQREILKQQQAERAEKMKSMRDRRQNGKSRGERTRRGKRDIHKKVDSTSASETSPEKTE